MRFSTRTHGFLDFALALLLVLAAVTLGIAGEAAGVTLIAVGIALLANVLVTDMEAGRVRTIHMPVHLWIDGFLGVLLAISPWMLAFYRTAWAPHLVLGLIIAALAFLTHTVPGYERRGASRSAAE